VSTQDVQKGQTDDPEFGEVRTHVFALLRKVWNEQGREAARLLVDLFKAYFGDQIGDEEMVTLGRGLIHRGECAPVAARLAEMAGR